MGEESLPGLVLILTFSSSVCGAFGLQVTSKLPLLMLLARPSRWTALYGTQDAARSRLSGEWLTWLVPRQPGLRPPGDGESASLSLLVVTGKVGLQAKPTTWWGGEQCGKKKERAIAKMLSWKMKMKKSNTLRDSHAL